MMKFAKFLLAGCAALCATAAFAHEGHGTPGSFGHDLQHQLWTVAALVAVGALLLGGDQVLAVLRGRSRRRRGRRDSEDRSD